MLNDGKSASENTVYVRVLIVDDQLRARRSLKALLTAMCWRTPSYSEQPSSDGYFAIEIVGEAENGQQAMAQVAAFMPDVVVMDLQMSELHGVSTIRNIKSQWPQTRIVVLTMYATNRAPALAAGADAFLLKGCPAKELLDALRPGESTSPG